MIIKKAVEQVIDSGVKPIKLDLQKVSNFDGELEGIRTSLEINSLTLGVLTANEYRYVARRTDQGSKLVERNIEKLFFFYDDLVREFKGAKFFTVSVYARALKGEVLYQTLCGFFDKYPSVDATKICLEFSADILFENLKEYNEELNKIKQLGVKVALCEVGQQFCPLLRLNEIEYDFVFLDEYFIEAIKDREKEYQVNVVMNIVNARYCKAYCSSVTADLIDLLGSVGVDGYTLSSDAELEDKEWRLGGKEEDEIT
jgi:EAL domain-containing protein (putative c-di-GMP-specific phosphodiesterase class I)